jgi:hypothetical protein
MNIVLKSCSYEIKTDGKSMEEIFGVPKGMIREIKRMCKDSKSLEDAVHFMIAEGKYKEALILLVAVWNTLSLEKK